VLVLGALICGVAIATGCRAGPTAAHASAARPDSAAPWRKPGDKIDSILPMAEYVRRFRTGLAEPTAFAGGAADRDALARRFLDAVSRRDTAVLRSLLVTRAEFAWLVFPDHLYSHPPYELDPDIFWLQLREETGKGATRVLQRYGGVPLTYLGLQCQRDTVQIVSGPDTVWSKCRLRYRAGDSTLTRGLFGSIVQRGSQSKFLSYHSEF
jgi:hypothetical protein